MAEDLTPPIPPIAFSLHDAFLPSHCSSCFRPIETQNPESCPTCNSSSPIRYCSPLCSIADHRRHLATGECRLLRSTTYAADTAAPRAALRLLLSLAPARPARRFAGLLSAGLDDLLRAGGDLADRIRDDGRLMSRARGTDRGPRGEETSIEEAALWVVLRNAVEVHVSDEGAIGIAVYGPHFSWFNHSCSPNACFRFHLPCRNETRPRRPEPDRVRVMPAGDEEDAGVLWEDCILAESKLDHGLCDYGPMVVVRSIKPIRKGEEVCIAYTDLLQPKAVRHFDLWSKYRFVCCCERCDASPQMHVDYILSCDVRNLNLDQNETNPDCEELTRCLDRAIDTYMSYGNPESCCENLERMLSGSFQDEDLQAEEPPRRKFMLHPLHYLSLNAYIVLASAYRVRANNSLSTGLSEDNKSNARAAVAYSLLLAGATNHLLLFDSSLIASVAVFCTSAEEAILGLARSLARSSTDSTIETGFCLISDHSQWAIREGSSVSWDEFRAASMGFLECLPSILLNTWPFLVRGFPYLESIRSPINFNWLGTATNYVEQLCPKCNDTERLGVEVDTQSIIQLGVHCQFYGRYLSTICYGVQR